MVTEENKAPVRIIVGLALLSALLIMLLPAPVVAAKGKPSPRTWQAQVAVESRDHTIGWYPTP